MKNRQTTQPELVPPNELFDIQPEPAPEPEDEQPTTTEFFSSLADALRFAAPEGSTVSAVGFDSLDAFLRLGYRMSDGRADIAVARGGEREFAAARRLECRKLVLVPTHGYAAAATELYRDEDGAFAVMRQGKKPTAAVFDKTDVDRNLASIFGEIVSLDLCAFDLAFGMYLGGNRVDHTLCRDVGALITQTTSALRGREKEREYAAGVLVEAGKTAAKIAERAPELLHASGASQMSEAVRMLYSAEERPLGMRGETEMLLCAVVADYYIKNLGSSILSFPPDNNRRIDSLCEYFGTDVRRACIYAAAIYPPIKMRLYEYRRAEFRSEQTKLLVDVKNRQTAARRVFKRLYPDDGYGLKTLVDKTDLGLCLSLAPDVFAANSMLAFLKQTGKLEKYIV